MMIKVIINADDLGKDSNVNEAISEAMDFGVITSSTILANSNCLDDVKLIIQKHPECSFGIHLNLTEGKCLAPTKRMLEVGLIDENECFTKHKKLINGDDKVLLKDIECEFEAQMQMLLCNGIVPSHIDGHHHVHTIYCLRKVVLNLCKAHKITKIRNRYCLPFIWNIANKCSSFRRHFENNQSTTINQKPSMQQDATIATPLNFLEAHAENLKWRLFFWFNGIKTTRYFDSYEHFLEQKAVHNHINPNSTIELMCHPGHINYCAEYQSIKNKKIDNLIDIQYVTYNDF